MLGKCEYALKGKIMRQNLGEVIVPEVIPLPRTIEEDYHSVTLAADVLHVNGIAILATVSRNLHYTTVSALPSMKHKDLADALRAAIRSYSIRGFSVDAILVDGQFDGLQDRFKNDHVAINPVAKEEHVPEIERLICVIKEQA